jgi:hypothetical protein
MLAQHPAQGELDVARAERWSRSMGHERNAELECHSAAVRPFA